MCLLTKFRKRKKIKEKASKLTREASVVVVAVVVKLQDNKLDEGNILKAQGFFFTSHIFTIKLASKVRRRRKKVCVYEKVSKTLSLSLFPSSLSSPHAFMVVVGTQLNIMDMLCGWIDG